MGQRCHSVKVEEMLILRTHQLEWFWPVNEGYIFYSTVNTAKKFFHRTYIGQHQGYRALRLQHRYSLVRIRALGLPSFRGLLGAVDRPPEKLMAGSITPPYEEGLSQVLTMKKNGYLGGVVVAWASNKGVRKFQIWISGAGAAGDVAADGKDLWE